MLEQSGAAETSEFSLVLMKMICFNGRLVSAWNISFIFFFNLDICNENYCFEASGMIVYLYFPFCQELLSDSECYPDLLMRAQELINLLKLPKYVLLVQPLITQNFSFLLVSFESVVSVVTQCFCSESLVRYCVTAQATPPREQCAAIPFGVGL